MRLTVPPTTAAVIFGCAAAVFLGLVASRLGGVLVGLMTLLPVMSHARWVGWRRAIAEPSVITIILFFYLCVFPQRALGIATSSYSAIDLTLGQVTGTELALTLALASVGTTVLIESFHFARQRRTARGIKTDAGPQPESSRVLLLAGAFAVLALSALVVVLIENDGLAATTAVFYSHSKGAAGEARSLAASAWAVLAVPAVWCAALVIWRDNTHHSVQLVFLAVGAVILIAQVLVFGSRLSALLAVMGVWMIAHSSGRRVPVAAVLVSIPVVLLVSVSILSQRAGSDFDNLPPYERYSRVAAYGVLDAALAVRERPGNIQDKLMESSRWLNFPLYLVPSPVWPAKPRIDDRRLDVYVVQAVGTQYQQDTGFPTTYITEMRLYGGWPAVLLASAITGLLLGLFDRRLLGSARQTASPASLLWYCFVIGCGFTYYKDGDLLVTALGQVRTGVYLGLAMLVTGLWSLGRRGQGLSQVPPRRGAPASRRGSQ